MNTTIEKEKKRECRIRCEEKVSFVSAPHQNLFLFVRLISERGVRRK